MQLKAAAQRVGLVADALRGVRLVLRLYRPAYGLKPPLGHELAPRSVGVYLVFDCHRAPVVPPGHVYQHHAAVIQRVYKRLYAPVQLRYVRIFGQFAARGNFRQEDVSPRVDRAYFAYYALVGAQHPLHGVLGGEVVVPGVQQYDVGRVLPVYAVDARFKKLHVLAAEAAVAQPPYAALALARPYEVGVVPCGEQTFPQGIQVRAERGAALRNRVAKTHHREPSPAAVGRTDSRSTQKKRQHKAGADVSSQHNVNT